jgi:voltage-gated potassium channel
VDNWRLRARRVIFEADTPGGRAFDVALLVLIVFSVLLVMVESITPFRQEHAATLLALEWVVTILFTVEYVARLVTAEHPGRYARSFFGIIDLLAILPVYISAFIPGAQSLLVVRSLRLLRVFRVFKMAQWLREANYLLRAVQNSTQKILVFLLTVLLINVIVGSTMYTVEGPANGFDSMFTGVYWSIVTMSTVGFGDIAPSTGLGQVLAACLMIMGYSVIAVPTGIVSAEVTTARNAERRRACPACGHTDHGLGARFCERCGTALDSEVPA